MTIHAIPQPEQLITERALDCFERARQAVLEAREHRGRGQLPLAMCRYQNARRLRRFGWYWLKLAICPRDHDGCCVPAALRSTRTLLAHESMNKGERSEYACGGAVGLHQLTRAKAGTAYPGALSARPGPATAGLR